MFSRQQFKDTCKILAIYSSNWVTPMQVLSRLRDLKKTKEIKILSDVFESMPGFATCIIQDFIGEMRLKVIVD